MDTYYAEIEIKNNSTFNYWITIESEGIWYNTSKKQLTIEDLTPPSIHNVLWTPTSPVVDENVTIMCMVDDNSGLLQVILSYYDDKWHNVTMHYNYSTEIYQAIIIGTNTTVFFKIYAQDDNGNWAVTELYSIEFREVEEITGDQPPSILSVLWTPTDPAVGENVSVYVWVSDDYGISNVVLSYYIHEWHNITMQYNSSIEAYVIAIPSLLVNGTLFFKVYVFDTAGQCTVSDMYEVSFSVPISRTPPEEVTPSEEATVFGMTAEGVIVLITLVSIVSLVVGIGIGLRKRKSK